MYYYIVCPMSECFFNDRVLRSAARKTIVDNFIIK